MNELKLEDLEEINLEEIKLEKIRNIVECLIKKNDLTQLKKLLSQLDVHYLYSVKYNPYKNILSLSYESHTDEITEYLLTIIDVDEYVSSDTGYTVLMQILDNVYVWDDRLHQLLSHTKNIDKQNVNTGRTVLHQMTYLYHEIAHDFHESVIFAIKTLIEYGADPYDYDYKHDSIINTAAMSSGAIKLLTVLLNNKMGKYVEVGILYDIIMVNMNQTYDVIELLLPHIKNINEPCFDGNNTLLWHVRNCEYANKDVIELLEMHGAHP